jgi:DNA mismatch repair protein MutL
MGHQRLESPKALSSHSLTVAEPAWEYSRDEREKHIFNKEIERPSPLIEERVRVIGQLKNTYILCQTKDGLLLLDQHAAHERVVYETLKKSYPSSHIESQAFLVPYQLELSLKDGQIVLERLDQLERWGLGIEHFGGRTFIIRSIPSILVNAQWDQFLLDLIPIMDEESDLASENALDRLWTVMACHSAIRAGQSMSHREMDRLLEQLEQMDLPTNCPHGRPIFKMFTFGEIEKMFKRVI